MAKGIPITTDTPVGSIETAVLNGDWAAARLSMAVKLAKMLDNTDSARDVKSLALSLDPLLDRCAADQVAQESTAKAPIYRILEEARSA